MKPNRKKTGRIRRRVDDSGADYPSLQEHMLTRRRFLRLAGVSLAAGGVLAGCGRNLGIMDGDGGVHDSGVDGGKEPDADVEILGVMQEPDYFTLRIPGTGETTAYLEDGGICRFYVNVATYDALSHDLLRDNPGRSQEVTRETVADFTYDDLETEEGIVDAEAALRESLLELLEGWADGELMSIEAVTLVITHLEPEQMLDGGMPRPDYP